MSLNSILVVVSLFILGNLPVEPPIGERQKDEAQKIADLNSQSLAKLQEFDLLIRTNDIEAGMSSILRWQKNGPFERIDESQIWGSQFTNFSSTYFDLLNRKQLHFSKQVPAAELGDRPSEIPLMVGWADSYEAWRAPLVDYASFRAPLIVVMHRIQFVSSDLLWPLSELVSKSQGVRLEYDGNDPVLVIQHPGVDGEFAGDEIVVTLSSSCDYMIRKISVTSSKQGWRTVHEGSEFFQLPNNGCWIPGTFVSRTGTITGEQFTPTRTVEKQITASEIQGDRAFGFRFPDQSRVKALTKPVIMGVSTENSCVVEIYRNGEVEEVVQPAEFKAFMAKKLEVPIESLEKHLSSGSPQAEDSVMEPRGLFTTFLVVIAVLVSILVWRKYK
jgi:hypothetical protein